MSMNQSIIDSTASNRPLEIQIVLTITLALIIFLAIFGNVLVFVTILRSSNLRRQSSSYFLLNLAITDIGCAILVMPFALVSLWQNEWIFGDFWCDGVCFFNYCFIIVSMATLALISLDKFIFVVHPLHYEELVTKTKAVASCCVGWIIGIVFGVAPPVVNWVWYDNNEIICAINWENDTFHTLAYTVTAFVFCFMFPITVMCFAYYKIYKVARSHAKRIARTLQSARVHRAQDGEGRPSVSSDAKPFSKHNAKAIKTILIMVLAYILCNTPFSLTKLIKVVHHDNESVPDIVNSLASWLAFVNPCCNPIIYAITRAEFRNAFLKTLCCKRLRRKLLFNSLSEKASFTASPSVVTTTQQGAYFKSNKVALFKLSPRLRRDDNQSDSIKDQPSAVFADIESCRRPSDQITPLTPSELSMTLPGSTCISNEFDSELERARADLIFNDVLDLSSPMAVADSEV